MNPEEIKEQIRQFSQKRFNGFIIHSRAGLEIPYMQKEWMEACTLAVSEAERLNLEVWLYDEDGWPSGFAGGLIPAMGDEYCYKKMSYGYSKQDAECAIIIAAFRKENENSYKRLNLNDTKDGDLFFYYTIDRHYVDLLNPATTDKFIESTHEKYKEVLGKYFGKTIKGIFTDEPQLNISYPWGHNFPEYFEQQNGYSLLDSLWKLAYNLDDYRHFRKDFWLTINKLFRENFTEKLNNWCLKNNLILTGHFAAEDGLCDQVASNGGVMTHYEYMKLPGIDHLGNRLASVLLLKQASSVSNQLGDGHVLSETFGCSGWSIPFSQLCWIWGWQSSLGATKPCYHLAAYSISGIRKRDYPCFFSYQQLWWDSFSHLTGWMDGLNRLMSEGKRMVNTLVISPIISLMSEYEWSHSQRTLTKQYSNQMRVLAENLVNTQVDFEIGDEQLLEKYAYIDNGYIYMGNSKYNLVFVSQCDTITSNTWELLKKFAEQGGTIVFVNSRPSYVDCMPNQEINLLPALDIQNRRNLLEKLIKYMKFPFPIEIYYSQNIQTASNFSIHTRLLNNGEKRIHIWHGGISTTTDVVIRLPGNCEIYRLDPATHEQETLPSYFSNGFTYLDYKIEAKENLVLETGGKSQSPVYSKTLIKEQLIEDPKISICHYNCLTIDRASYSINGSPFSEEKPVIHIVDELYNAVAKINAELNVIIDYTFNCDKNVLGNEIRLAAEDKQCLKIKVNGNLLSTIHNGWWIDTSISEHLITDYLQTGVNHVQLHYIIPKQEKLVNIHEVFETERNRFSYPIEPENIYIRGDFDLKAEGSVLKCVNHYTIADAKFALVPSVKKNYGDLTTQNLWFYRGNAEYEFLVEKPETNLIITIALKKHYGSLIKVIVNKKEKYLFCPPFEVDITDLLIPGDNKVKIVLIGTNRNLLGPHHHIKGENNFVGLSVFKGQRGFEDFVSPEIQENNTWTDNYSFIPFGIEEAVLRYYKKALYSE